MSRWSANIVLRPSVGYGDGNLKSVSNLYCKWAYIEKFKSLYTVRNADRKWLKYSTVITIGDFNI